MNLKRIEDTLWILDEDTEHPAYVFGSKRLVDKMKSDRTLNQLKNVANLPDVVEKACVMPDGHEGYGFPIGGVVAFDAEEGIVSPGGIGYDINCGVRMIKTPLKKEEVLPKIRELCDLLYKNIPSGVGSEGRLKLSHDELDEAVMLGVDWAVERDMATDKDKRHTEEYGRMDGADPEAVSQKAKKRGRKQLGTLGAGNHFLEVQTVDSIMDIETAKQFGLEENQVVVMVHCGSRGYGHQICSDMIPPLISYARRNDLPLPEQELAYAKIGSDEGDRYLKGMRCAVNFAFLNRQIITHWVRETFGEIWKGIEEEMDLLYDVAHNIAKEEIHETEEGKRKLLVHRKGATRAFPKGREELPDSFRDIGQPVLIPGSMGTSSYVLVGREKGLELSWGSSCHGAGRQMSRSRAKRQFKGKELREKLWKEKSIYIRAGSPVSIAEEAPGAYKNVDEVVSSVEDVGISGIVAKMVPMGVVKG